MQDRVKALLKRNEDLKKQRQYWFPLYEALARYVFQRKQNFTTDRAEGPFLLNQVYDSTAIHAAHMMASSILGQVWPNPFESFEFVPQVAQEDAVFSDAFDMMTTVNEVMPANLAIPEAGVMTSFGEAILDAVVFGTGGIVVQETGDIKVPIVCKAVDAKCASYAENEHGQIDTVYQEKEFTVATLVQRYGLENVSEKIRKLYEAPDGKHLDEKVKVLHVIEPRRERNPLKLGNQDMPFASIHIEIDQKHLLLESGYEENPVIIFRFWKNVGEVLGRSPAMDALADIRALNKLVEIFEKTGEMGLDPPKLVATDDIVGAGKIPWGPGAWIATHKSGLTGTDKGGRAIEPVMTVTNPSWAIQQISNLRDNIQQYFMLDKLTDLSNRSRQTLGEANIRNELRQFMTGPMLTRLIVELVGPFLDRCFNILLQLGAFGVIEGSRQDMQLQMAGISPKYISQDFMMHRMGGLKGYRINYISPAARLMKLEEAQGLDSLTQFVLMLAQVQPDVVHNFDFDEAVRTRQRLSGASQKILRSPAKVRQLREQAAAAQAQQMQVAQEMGQASTFAEAAKGVKDIGAAGLNL
ncbi:MAG: head-tail connector protein [Candidatus Obscuribacterales bacterium]|nr:head-tail connector protein [Candidatus Obscuribacterales bacterium]